MPRAVNPIDDEEIYNGILLDNVRSPGVVKLSGHDRVINWDVKAASGQKGASTSLKDIPLRTFKATFFLSTVEQFEQWMSFRDLINSSVNGKIKALDVYHPDLEVNGFISVVLANFGGVVHDGRGGQSITVEFQEYSPPVKKSGIVQGADPNAAAKKELAELTEAYKKTPWG